MERPVLSVVIPVFNEKDSLVRLVGAVEEVGISKEIIIVDDASTDGTADVIRQKILPGTRRIKTFRHEKNQGKGAAIRTGLKAVEGDIVII